MKKKEKKRKNVLRTFAPIATAHHYCARKFTPRPASSARALSNKMNNDRKDDITASVPVTTGPNLTDSSHYEGENIKRWADKNLMTLNMKKTFEMVVKGKTTMPLPEPVDGIIRKSELKLLGVTVNEDPCNWDVQF